MAKVSVVIPTYNSAKYIVSTVESVLNQTYPDFEVIVVDDGSTDETQQLLQPYRDRISYIFQENKKYSGARNTGLRAATGEYIAFLDSDDLWLPTKLEEQVAVFSGHPDVVLVHCAAAYIDPQGQPVKYKGKQQKGTEESSIIIANQSRALFTFDTIITTSTVMFRRSLLNEVGLFDDTHIHGEDWELWVRLGAKGPFAYISKPLAEYRVYGWQKVLKAESSQAWVQDQFRTVERASSLWQGDAAELAQLRARSTETIYRRAALASYQLGHGAQGRDYLEKALAADPELNNKERLLELAVDRAKAIENDTGVYDEAVNFIETLFANLPVLMAHLKHNGKEAIAWLYLGGAFEKAQEDDAAAVRRLLSKAVTQSPVVLRNRGVISLAVEAWLGKSVANLLRRAG